MPRPAILPLVKAYFVRKILEKMPTIPEKFLPGLIGVPLEHLQHIRKVKNGRRKIDESKISQAEKEEIEKRVSAIDFSQFHSRFEPTKVMVYYIHRFRVLFPKIRKVAIGRLLKITGPQVNVCLKRKIPELPEEEKKEIQEKIKKDAQKYECKDGRARGRKFSDQEITKALTLKAQHFLMGKRITNKQLAQMCGISKTRVDHFNRSKRDIAEYNTILEKLRQEEKKVYTLDNLCQEIVVKMPNDDLWSDLEAREHYGKQRKLSEKTLEFILRKKVEKITAEKVCELVQQKGFDIMVNSIHAVWKSYTNIYPAELKRMGIPVPVYEYLVHLDSPYKRWGVPEADKVIDWWRKNDFAVKKEHVEAKTICKEHKLYCCRHCLPKYYLVRKQSSRIRCAFRNQKLKKSDSTITLLGCSMDFLYQWIKKQLREGMTMTNIHIDHIRPVSLFDLSDPKQIKQCCHYTNLQPLFPQENLSKHNRWSKKDEKNWRENIIDKSLL